MLDDKSLHQQCLLLLEQTFECESGSGLYAKRPKVGGVIFWSFRSRLLDSKRHPGKETTELQKALLKSSSTMKNEMNTRRLRYS